MSFAAQCYDCSIFTESDVGVSNSGFQNDTGQSWVKRRLVKTCSRTTGGHSQLTIGVKRGALRAGHSRATRLFKQQAETACCRYLGSLRGYVRGHVLCKVRGGL
jgi:hypothetical protein